MKKYLFIALAAFSFITLSQSCKKKVSDADIKTNVEAKLKEMPDMSGGVMVADVKDGAVTLSGQCKDEACKAKCGEEAGKVKGVKSVTNNCTVAPPPPPPAPMPSATDAAIQAAGDPLIKDIKGATLTISGGVATVTGVADVAKRGAIKQALTKAGAKNVEFK